MRHLAALRRLPASAVVAVLRGYQRFVSPLLGPHCRFHPSCSEYAVGALRAHGLLRGGGLALRRVARCQPFFPGGIDPVPLRQQTRGALR